MTARWRLRNPHRVPGVAGIATRRLAALAALLVVGCVAVTAAVLVGVYRYQTRLETQRLFDTAAAYVTEPAHAPAGMYLAVSASGAMTITPGMPPNLPDVSVMNAVAADGQVRDTSVDLDSSSSQSGFFEVQTRQVGGRTAQLVLDRSAVEETEEHLAVAVGLAGAVAVVLAAGAAAFLARRAAAPLAQTVALQRRFVADASHELRTPLTLLSTRVQMQLRRLSSEHASPKTTAEAEAIVRDVTTMTEILDDLLTTAAQHRTEDRTPVDLAEVGRDAVESATEHAAERDVRLRYASHLTAGEPHRVEGRKAALRRALTALLDNAIEHAATEVELAVSATPRHLLVTVTDDGPGIDASARDRIFEPFYSRPVDDDSPRAATRTSAAGVPASENSRRHYGIGLALVAGVATDHDGDISVNAPDHGAPGTRFILSLPALPPSRVPPRRQAT